MKQFYSPRTRLFYPNRMALRHALLPVLAIGAVYFGLQAFSEKTDTSTETLTIPLTASAAPAPQAQMGNLKSVFETVPAAPAYHFAQADSQKPVAVTSAADLRPQAEAFSRQIAAIQSGISNILAAGTEMFVSTRKVVVGKGDTLMELLVKNKVPRDEAHEAIMALSKIYDPKDLNIGHEITVFFHQDPSVADPKFSGLSIEKDMVNTVIVNKKDDGSFRADQKAKEVSSSHRAFHGTIDGSLYMSAKDAGVPDGVILDMIKMYSWNVDFQREIQPGDQFDVMYEEYKTEDGEIIPGRGHIVYAKLSLGDRVMPFYRFEDASGDVDYYDEEGKSAKRPLMRTPIDGARLSSGFGMRKHPVLGYNKMHKGLDFAAPRGTPIYAAGDGTITKMGPFSSYGKYVRIRHRSGLETAYAHMRGFKAGLKSGSRIKQGQVIGYVGTTGRSTGPHLHYEVIVSGKSVNPSSVKLPTGKALAGADLKKFHGTVADFSHEFLAQVTPAAVAANAIVPAAGGQ